MDIRRRLFYAVLILATVTSVSVSGYLVLGGPAVTVLQAVYMAVITLAGVGYGEIIDTGHNPALRIFNMFVVLIGVTLTVYVFSVVTAFLVEGEISNIFGRRKMQRRISELKDHFIVCGLGDTGRYAVEELQKTGTPYVVIERTEEHVARFREHAGDDYKDMVYIIGDATDEETIERAGIDRAQGLISTLPADKDNLVLTVMVRQRREDIRIVSRCTDVKFSDRIQKAGANSTVSPNRIGGLRLASEVIRPHVVGFLDLMLKEQSRTLRVEEIEIKEGSHWRGKSLTDLNLRGRFNLLPLAVKHSDDPSSSRFWVNPPDNAALKEGMVLIVMGDMHEIRKARHEAVTHPVHVNAAAAR